MKENIYGLIKLHPIKYKKGRKVKLKKFGTKRMNRRRTSIRMNRRKKEFFDELINKNQSIIARNPNITKEQFKNRVKNKAIRRYLQKIYKKKYEGSGRDSSFINNEVNKFINSNLNTTEKLDKFYKDHYKSIMTQKNIRDAFKETVFAQPYMTVQDSILHRILYKQMDEESRNAFFSYLVDNKMNLKFITIENRLDLSDVDGLQKNGYQLFYKGKALNKFFAYLKKGTEDYDPSSGIHEASQKVSDSLDTQYQSKFLNKGPEDEDEDITPPTGKSVLQFLEKDEDVDFKSEKIGEDDEEEEEKLEEMIVNSIA